MPPGKVIVTKAMSAIPLASASRPVARMLAGGEARHPELEVRADRSGDDDRVDIPVIQDTLGASRRLGRRVAPVESTEALGVTITYPCHLDVGVVCQDAQEVRSPVPQADH